MKTKKAVPATLPAPMHRDAWVSAFASVAVRLWPELGLRHATTVGLTRSTGALASDPEEAASMWVAEAKAGRL